MTKLSSHMYSHIKCGNLVKCPYPGCVQQDFKTVSSLKSHFYRTHYKCKQQQNLTISDNLVNLEMSNDTELPDLILIDPSEVSTVNYQDEYVKSLATTYLTLQSKHFLTDSALQRLIDGISDINQISMKNVSNILELQTQTDFTELLQKESLFNTAHHPSDGALRSAFMRKKYYKHNFNYVAPVEITLQGDSKHLFFSYVPYWIL